MRLLALSVATTIATTFSVSAADIGYPAPVSGRHYGLTPDVSPPQVIIVPAPHQYDGAADPPEGGYSPYGVAPPRADVVPRAACAPVWRCGIGGCDWQPVCSRHPERYSGGSGSLDPQFYPDPDIAPAPEPYNGTYAPAPHPGRYSGYGSPHPQVYGGRGLPAVPGPYSGTDTPAPRPEHYSGEYGRPDSQVYAAPGVPPAAEPYAGLYAPAPRPEHYSGGYVRPDPQVYPRRRLPQAQRPYSGPPAPQASLDPDGSYSGGESSTIANWLGR
jgi:hypothetical protein